MIAFAWGAWALAVVTGAGMFMLRSTETGLAYVNLPRLFYFMWVLTCVLLATAFQQTAAAALGLAFAAAVGIWAFVGDEPAWGTRLEELRERAAGCRRALAEDERNPMSLELLGDAYSTLEDPVLALKYWEKSYAIVQQTGLREKIERAKRPAPSFYYSGPRAARDARACPGCEEIVPRLAASCRACSRPLFSDAWGLRAARFNRFCEETGAGAAIESGLLLLPFLYFCAPWAYGLAWLVWIGARRPGPKEAM